MIIRKPVEFLWDKGNQKQNWLKHKVKIEECEEVFFDLDKNEYPDPKHSTKEKRSIIVGRTTKSKTLFVVFTIRKNKIRIISARDLNKRERSLL